MGSDFVMGAFGAAATLAIGVLLGAGIVGTCWAVANHKLKEAYNQHFWDAKADLKDAKAKLIKRSLRKLEKYGPAG